MSIKQIVYIGEFDKYDNNGNTICRNTGCFRPITPPFRKYCSKECNRQFEKWYYHNFYWERVRSDIFRRDDYTCQLCKIKYKYTYRRKFARSKILECDHIIPKSHYKQLGYKFDTLEEKIRTVTEFFHNHNNLRTLCKICHRQVTRDYLKKRSGQQNNQYILTV